MDFFTYQDKNSLFWYPTKEFVLASDSLREGISLTGGKNVYCQDNFAQLSFLARQKFECFEGSPVRRRAVEFLIELPDDALGDESFCYYETFCFVRPEPVYENGDLRYIFDPNLTVGVSPADGFREVKFFERFQNQSTVAMVWKSSTLALTLKR